MKKSLPDIPTRTASPTKFIIKPSKPLTSLTPTSFNKRYQSNSPPRKNSNNSLTGIRTISDEITSVRSSNSSKKSIFGKISPVLSDLDSQYFNQKINPRVLPHKQKMYTEIVDTLFSLCKSNPYSCPCISASSLFFALGYSSDFESLIKTFQLSFSSDSEPSDSFSKSDLLKICEDAKLDTILRVLIKSLKDSIRLPGQTEFDVMIQCIKKWWSRLDVSRNGFVPTEDVLKFLVRMNTFESSVHVRKSFTKNGIFMNFAEFFKVFARGLVKFLMLSLCDDAGDKSLLAQDIVINAKRRKIILAGISGGNKVVDVLLQYKCLV